MILYIVQKSILTYAYVCVRACVRPQAEMMFGILRPFRIYESGSQTFVGTTFVVAVTPKGLLF